MKIGVIGLGSMGKRRVRDLLRLGHDVVGFDSRDDRRKESTERFSIVTVESFEQLLQAAPRASVISTPPDQHQMYYELCFANKLPFFSEANIFTPRAEWFAQRELGSGVRGYPSGTWLFHPLFHALKDELEKLGPQQVNSINYHYAGYLPFWHPWERYTDFYAGDRKTSAGREMVPFEMEPLVWLFGPVQAVTALQARASEWDSDIDDTYLLLLEFECGIKGTLLVELHQISLFRVARISTRKNSFTLDLAAHELNCYNLDTETWRKIWPQGMRSLSSFNFEDIYRAEIEQFIEALNGATYSKTWEHDRHLSNILFAAELSWSQRKWVTIAEVESLYSGLDWWQ
ncbi:MAG: Gfo/Idh/MocA family protein [Burkholderiales bacterium]